LDEVGNLMFQDFIENLEWAENAGAEYQSIIPNISTTQETFCFAPFGFKMRETKLFQGHSNVKVNFFLCGEHGGEKIE
jgi:hypothetical protein